MIITLSEYIEQNKLCNEFIFEDYNKFLEILFASNGVVSMIVWFDYCKIANQSEFLGAGGYIDKRDNDYMWAETQIYEIGLDNKTLSEILQYIEDIKNTYQDYKLYPAFYIAEWKSK
ncbi:MAG: hypothetical protein E7263_10695 [Lachnospiraceae bacterium]|nr:hypothetical protein [Lachnospiraceae bacterium]